MSPVRPSRPTPDSRRRRSVGALGVAVAAIIAAGGVAGAQLAEVDADELLSWAIDADLLDEPLDDAALASPPDRLEVIDLLRRLDMLVGERSLAAGPISVSHPPAVAVAHDGDAVSVSHEGGSTVVTGSGRVLVPLTAPSELGGRKLVFSSVEVCMDAVAPGDVVEVVLLQSPDGGGVLPATEVPRESGCTTFSGAGSGWVSGQAATLQVEVAAGRSVRIVAVSSTWVPS